MSGTICPYMRGSQLALHATKSAFNLLTTFVIAISILSMIAWGITQATSYPAGAVSNGIWIVVAGLLLVSNISYLAHVGVSRSFIKDYLVTGTHGFTVLCFVAAASVLLRNAADLGVITIPRWMLLLIDVLFWGGAVLVVVHAARDARQTSEHDSPDAI